MNALARLARRALPFAAFAAVLAWGTPAHASTSDSMQISVTPSVTYGVQISSPMAGGYQFGTVALGASTESTAAITVTNSGTVSEFFSMAITNTSGGWQASTSTPTTDRFRMTAEFSGTQPNISTGFLTSDALTTSAPLTAATLYGQAGVMTPPAGSNTQKLWLKLEMPPLLNSGTTGGQTMTVTIVGQAN